MYVELPPRDVVTVSLIRNTTVYTSPASAAKYVIVVTYQRCGSSFFGEIFNQNPSVFYAYEPLDSLYSSLYGTPSGWNVPSDITNNPDGTARYGRPNPSKQTTVCAVLAFAIKQEAKLSPRDPRDGFVSVEMLSTVV